MPYNALTDRSDTAALIPENVSNALLEGVTSNAAALSLFRRITVPTRMTRFPVLSALPQAYWVDGDTGLKQTTEMAWSSKYLTVEKLAVVAPVAMDLAEDLQDGGNFDLWEEIRPLLEDAIAQKIDAAVFFGVDKPSTQPTAIVPAAIAAGNNVVRGTAAQNAGGIAEDFNQLFGKVENDGFGVNSIITDLSFRTKLRSARATDGQKLLDVSTGALDGVPVTYAMDGQWPSGSSAVEAIVGDKNRVILGIRKDFYSYIWKEATLMDDEGNVIFNLAQQNMFGLVVEFRLGWVTANPINRRPGDPANKYPFGVMQAPA